MKKISYGVESGSDITLFIIIKIQSNEIQEIFIKYNAYFKKAVFHSRYYKKLYFTALKYKLYLTGEIGCPLLSPLTSLSPLQNFKRL